MDGTVPTRFNVPFADAAVAPYVRAIPEVSQIGIEAGAASLHDGFPPLTFTTPGAGGVPPFGADFNGLLKQVTQWVRFASCAGGPVPYDATFSTGIGGYPKGAILADAAINGVYWWSTKNANTTDPATPAQTDWQTFTMSYTGVTAGAYVRPRLTIAADGKVTAAANGTYPTRTILTSGSGTYTTPLTCKRLNIRYVGGGGGGGNHNANGVVGIVTTFNAVAAAPGAGGVIAVPGSGGTGGAGVATFRMQGNPGQPGLSISGNGTAAISFAMPGGSGGVGPWGGAGKTGGLAAAANSGAGGGGENNTSAAAAIAAGGGGGSGEYVELIINNPAATYAYSVGTGGAGAPAAGAGGSGVIIIDEFYD